ncbi:MAG: hypothetical protein AAGA77_02945 [Bacteroidota bacterium]
MAAPYFAQVNKKTASSAGDLLYVFHAGGVVINTTAYYPKDNPGGQITLADSWSSVPGYYLFFDEAIADQSTFATELKNYLNNPGHSNDRFLWIRGPNQHYTEWEVETLEVDQKKTSDLNQFYFRNYHFVIGGNCTFTLNNDGSNYWFTLTKGSPSDQPFMLSSGWGANRFILNESSVNLSFASATTGCWQFNFALIDGDSTKPSWDTMDMGIRYYINDLTYEDNLKALRFPVFEPVDNDVPINASLDPANHLIATKTFFSLYRSDVSPPVLNTYYRTNFGEKIAATPNDSAQFVFAISPKTTTVVHSDPYTLVPMGSFTVGVAGARKGSSADNTEGVMLGISGLEYVGIDDRTGYGLHFFPDQNAYGGGFLPLSDKPSGDVPLADNGGLTNVATTSWAYLTPPATKQAIYYAQPESSVLHHVSNTGATAQFLNYLEAPVGNLCLYTGHLGANCSSVTQNTGTLTAFPMAPFGGIPTTDLRTYQLFEQQVLSPVRRKQISKLLQTPPTTHPGDVFAVTPQGLKIGLDTAKTYWKSLTIAHTGQQSDIGQGEQIFQYTDITGKFRAALQSNQQFLVITDPKEFQKYASINYKLTRQSFAKMQAMQNGPTIQILCKLQSTGSHPTMEGVVYNDLTAFIAALQARLTSTEFDTYKDTLLEYGAFSVITVGEREHYDLSTADLDALKATNCTNPIVPATVITAIENASPVIVNKSFATQQEYATAMTAALSAAHPPIAWSTYADVLTEFGKVITDGWTFDLSPFNWINNNTIIVFKYAAKPMVDLVEDTSTWSWSEAAGGEGSDPGGVQNELRNIIQNAKTRAETEVDFKNFVNKVTSEHWNGMLVLNAEVPLDSLPSQLQGLAAGINPANFNAHHLGMNITPVENDNGVLSLRDTSLFGLIYYEDLKDLVENGDLYQFKVLTLKVLFENSAITNFSSKIELYVSELFGDIASLITSTHGNNLILNGVYQKHDGQDSYVFVLNSDNIFRSGSEVLSQVEILHAEFNTIIPPDGLDPGAIIHTQFVFSGKMRFNALEGFDIFSFGSWEEGGTTRDGYLKFSNLSISMEFPQETPDAQTFKFNSDQLVFDMPGSIARPNSLYMHFPINLVGFQVGTKDTNPEDKGYMSLTTPLNQGNLNESWYAFVFNLDLGTMGGLTSDVGFKVDILAGWAAKAEPYNVYTGLKMPGSTSSSTEIPIEGILKLVFKSIEMTATETPANPATGAVATMNYILKWRSISLGLLGYHFPPGQIDVYVFGNPGNDNRTALGWYAAYAGEEDEEEEKDQQIPAPSGQ